MVVLNAADWPIFAGIIETFNLITITLPFILAFAAYSYASKNSQEAEKFWELFQVDSSSCFGLLSVT